MNDLKHMKPEEVTQVYRVRLEPSVVADLRRLIPEHRGQDDNFVVAMIVQFYRAEHYGEIERLKQACLNSETSV